MADSDKDIDDAELVRRIQTGSDAEAGDAFELLVNRHSSLLTHHLTRDKGLTTHEAEEVFWDTWLRAWRGIHRFEYRSSGVFPWIRKIADNIVLERLKRPYSHTSLEELEEGGYVPTSDDDSASQALKGVSRAQLRDAIQEMLAEAPDDYRIFIEYHFLYDFTPQEIMELQSWSRSKADTTKFRALKWLRSRLVERYGHPTIDGWLQPP